MSEKIPNQKAKTFPKFFRNILLTISFYSYKTPFQVLLLGRKRNIIWARIQN